jgi:tRNA G46 methylase TrmB
MLLLWLKKIKVGGKIHIATDDNSYQEFIFEQVYKLSDVSVEDVNQLSFMPNCIKRPVTKFELRGLQLGNKVKEWCLVKLR